MHGRVGISGTVQLVQRVLPAELAAKAESHTAAKRALVIAAAGAA